MLLAEALSWDIVTFLAGLTDSATGSDRYETQAILAAQGVLQSTISLTYCVPQGVCRGASTVIGNAVGAGDVRRAARAAWMSVLCGFCATAVLVSALTIFRAPVVRAFGAPAETSEVLTSASKQLTGELPWLNRITRESTYG